MIVTGERKLFKERKKERKKESRKKERKNEIKKKESDRRKRFMEV